LKNILIFSHEFPPRLGGAGVIANQLATNLSENYKVTVVTKKRREADFSNCSFNVIEIFTVKYLWIFSYILFYFFNDLRKYETIILNDGGAIFSAGLIFNENLLNNSIIYIHGVEKYFELNNFFSYFFKKIFKRSLKYSKNIIAVSHYITNEVFEEVKFLEFKDKVKIINNPIEKSLFFETQKSYIRNKYNIEMDSVVLISVSRIVKKKGYDHMYKLFKKIQKKSSKKHYWLIVGEGNYKNKLEQLINKENTKNIIFTGFVPQKKLRFYYSAADIFWLLSELKESYGNVYQEAQACNTIAIGWNKYGVKESINTKFGLLAKNDDEILKFVLNDYKLLNNNSINLLTSVQWINKIKKILNNG